LRCAARGRQKANQLRHDLLDRMTPNAMLAQSLRKWREDCAPVELKRYAKREWGAETCFLLPGTRSKGRYSTRPRFAALFQIIRSLLSIPRSKSATESGLRARRASVNQSVQSPEIPAPSILCEGLRPGLADSPIISLGPEEHRITAETASALTLRKHEVDEHH